MQERRKMFKKHEIRKEKYTFIIAMLLSIILISTVGAVYPQPSAPTGFVNISTISKSQSIGAEFTPVAGTISIININATTQDYKWKGIVGNITGKLALQDESSNSLFDWSITSVKGEIYATRSSSLLDWDNVSCAKPYKISQEQEELNFTNAWVDSINNTFNETDHAAFYAGNTLISADSCYSTNLFVNNQKTDAFEELLLQDSDDIIYTGLLEDSARGFDNNTYDFQMILPDWGNVTATTTVTYYFYVELI